MEEGKDYFPQCLISLSLPWDTQETRAPGATQMLGQVCVSQGPIAKLWRRVWLQVYMGGTVAPWRSRGVSYLSLRTWRSKSIGSKSQPLLGIENTEAGDSGSSLGPQNLDAISDIRLFCTSHAPHSEGPTFTRIPCPSSPAGLLMKALGDIAGTGVLHPPPAPLKQHPSKASAPTWAPTMALDIMRGP